MRTEDCAIEGVRIFHLEEHPDRRGSFFEMFRREWLRDIFDESMQVNCSKSVAGALRGMHYHNEQWDLWVPLSGRMRAGLADLRRGSSTFGTSTSLLMDDSRPLGLLIPPGVAHGFAALTDLILVYVVSRYYDGSDEHGIAWDDPAAGIEWGIEEPLLSDRDRQNPRYEPQE